MIRNAKQYVVTFSSKTNNTNENAQLEREI